MLSLKIRCSLVMLLFFVIFSFGIHGESVLSYDFERERHPRFERYSEDYIDYLFTSQEVNLAKITDSSITISSDNIDHEFLSKADTISTHKDYEVKYENGSIMISGLIPDLLYSSIYIEAVSGDESYLMEVRNFKTLKSQDPLKQFITKTLQYTLRSSVRPIDFYMWEDKILNKEVTPEEFVLNILDDPQVLYNLNSIDEMISRIYSSVFSQYIDNQDLEYWKAKFNEYKYTRFLSDRDVFSLIAKDMINTEDFSNKVEDLKLSERDVPESTHYLEFFDNNRKDYRYGHQLDNFYVMDYYELNRSKSFENSVELFLSDEFKDEPYYEDFYTPIEGAKVYYKDGAIVLKELESNTVYENFPIKYECDGIVKTIFVKSMRTSRSSDGSEFLKVNYNYNVLDDFGYSMDDFLKVFYEERYKISVYDNEVDELKLHFVSNPHKISELREYVLSNGDSIDTYVLINKLYDIIFDRVPDVDGLNYWASKFDMYKTMFDVGESIRKVCNDIATSDEFYNRFNDKVINYLIKENNYNKKLLI